jgi:hypothetical protein
VGAAGAAGEGGAVIPGICGKIWGKPDGSGKIVLGIGSGNDENAGKGGSVGSGAGTAARGVAAGTWRGTGSGGNVGIST